jgi:hypothetical protein
MSVHDGETFGLSYSEWMAIATIASFSGQSKAHSCSHKSHLDNSITTCAGKLSPSAKVLVLFDFDLLTMATGCCILTCFDSIFSLTLLFLLVC